VSYYPYAKFNYKLSRQPALSDDTVKMAGVRISDVLKTYDGSGDVQQWLQKVELVASLQKIKDVSKLLPLFLEGPALAVYQEMESTNQEDYNEIKRALMDAFAMNSFQAYEQFSRKKWTGEAVDVYLAELRRLAKLAEIENEVLLKRAFVVGMPEKISRELRAISKIETLSMEEILVKSRALMSEYVDENRSTEYVAYADPKRTSHSYRPSPKCYRCGGPHLLRFCKVPNYRERNEIVCWKCGIAGHVERNCPENNNSLSNQEN